MTKSEMQARIDQLEAMVEALRDGLNGVRDYANSPKFATGGGINPMDIDLRVREVLGAVADIEVLPYGLAHPLTNHMRDWGYPGESLTKHNNHVCGWEVGGQPKRDLPVGAWR